jgi:hypothetical protein
MTCRCTSESFFCCVVLHSDKAFPRSVCGVMAALFHHSILCLLHHICNLFHYIQQIVQKLTLWHVEECSVALLCS